MPGLKNKGTTEKIELCRRTERNREGGGERGRVNTSVTNLTNYQQHIRLGLTIRIVEGARLGNDPC